MRILLISSTWPSTTGDPRGAVIHHLATGLAERGVEPVVVIPGEPGLPSQSSDAGVTVVRAQYAVPSEHQRLATGMGGIVPNLQRRPWLALQVPALLRALRREAMLRAVDVDLVHAHWLYPSGVVGLAAARRAGIPLVVTAHGTDVNLALRIPPLAWWSRRVLSKADSLTAVSHAIARGLVALGARPELVEFLPLGVKVSGNIPAHLMSSEWHAFQSTPGLRVLFAGSLTRNKSPGVLLEAIHLLRQRGVAVSAALVGDGPLRESVQKQAVEMGGVWVPGPRPPEEIATWVRAANVVVLPSRAEGRGLILIEAMACSRPVVCSDIPGPDELVQDGLTGFRFPVGNAGALADRLAQLAADPELVDRLGRAGRNFVDSEGLRFEAGIDRHLALYERLLARNPGGVADSVR
jgi:glycosyltransferase involved in cell wall biosynthesis